MATDDHEQRLRAVRHLPASAVRAERRRQNNFGEQLAVSLEGTTAGADLFASQQGVDLPLLAALERIQRALHGGRANAAGNKKNESQLAHFVCRRYETSGKNLHPPFPLRGLPEVKFK